MSSPILKIDRVSKSFQNVPALKSVSFDVNMGEFIALVGPSGCGKTTLLNHIAGFLTPDAGKITIAGQDMNGVAPAQRPTSMVFQKLALFPHMTVAENIGFPLKLRKRPRGEIDDQVREMLALMDLDQGYLTRFPQQLSGGEQQRVALARSMISNPQILLLDEPLSALDAKLKKVLQAELKRLHRQLGVTFVHVTHDLEEAMILADRICVMRNGQILQLGPPSDIYYRPVDGFVASFIGDTNLIPVDISDASDGGLTFEGPLLTQRAGRLTKEQLTGQLERGPAALMVRPELLRIVGAASMEDDPGKPAKPYDCEMQATIKEVFHKGSVTQVHTNRADGLVLTIEIQGSPLLSLDVGDPVTLGFNVHDLCAVAAT